jgi:hypothetical protein
MPRALSCETMNGRRSTVRLAAALIGESLREMAVLVIVFAPLDLVVQSKSLTLRYVLGTMAVFAVLFVTGIALEVMWRWKR